MRLFSLTVFLCLAHTLTLFGQEIQQPKIGKMELKTAQNDFSQVDSSAAAVVIADYGNSYFQYNQNEGGFNFYFNHYKQVKILDKDGYNYADIEIPIYHSQDKEEVTGIKGYTYNIENGKLVKSKLDKSAVFVEKYSDNWNIKKFTMPDVKEGSIIEYQYTIMSPYTFNLRTWEFQSDIPTVYSQFEVSIPEYYFYQEVSSGYHPYSLHKKSSVAKTLTITSKERAGGYGGDQTTSFNQNSINYQANTTIWVARDVPAYKEEAYVNNSSDYLSKIEFELRGRQFPNQPYDAVMGDWNTLNNSLLESEDFGQALDNDGFLKNEVQPFEHLNDEMKIEKVMDLVKKNMEWNGSNRKYVTTTLKKAWDLKTGSSSDINMILIAALRKLDIEANPVIISTRNNGGIKDFIAISNQFNSVICVAHIGDKQYLLDATDRYVPNGILPVRCLNGKGRIISKSRPGWVELTTSTKSETSIIGQLSLSEDGQFLGKLVLTSKGYSAYGNRKTYLEQGDEKFVDNLRENNKKWKLSTPIFNGANEPNKPFVQEYEVIVNETVTTAGDLLFIPPLLTEGIKENPFKLKERQFPIDFSYPIKKSYMIAIKIPEGFEVDELPAPVNIALPGSAGKFQFVVNQVGDQISITNIYSINKAMFLPDEYAALKEFYNIMVAKHAEQIVLKKI